MVKLQLWIKADLENVTNLQPSTDDFDFFFKAECTTCRNVHDKWVSMNRVATEEVKNSKGNTANFVWSCSCRPQKQHSASFETSITPYSIDRNGEFQPFLTMDCRGLEFVDFWPKGYWTCTGPESGTVFHIEDADLGQEEWSDYDEKLGQAVLISNVKGEWRRA